MNYRKFGESYYIRMDRGDEIVKTLLEICGREGISSATFSGIGGCSSAEIQTFMPEEGRFKTRKLSGMLELVSLTGNVVSGGEGLLHHHTHGSFAYEEGGTHFVSAGHIKSVTVSYTAEIELRPVVGGTIQRRYDAETGTGFWGLE